MAVKSKVTKSYRFDDHTTEVVSDLRVRLNLSNNSEVLKRAITLLKLASDNQSLGGTVLLRNAGTDKEIVL